MRARALIGPVRALTVFTRAGLTRPSLKFRHGFWGLADQALTAAVSFVTTLLAATALSENEFGEFALALAAIYLVNTLQAGAITRPHNLLGAARAPERYAGYTAATALLQLAFSAASAVVGILATIAAAAFAPSAVPLLGALVFAGVAWQLQEFVRRVLYTEERGGDAFVNDLLTYAGQALVLVLIVAFGTLTAPEALVIIGATSLAGLALGMVQIRRSLSRILDPDAIRDNFAMGKWLAAAEAAHWTSTQIYLYVAALLLGPVAAATIRATQVLFGPLRIVLTFLYSVLPVSFSRARANAGPEALHREVGRAYLMVVPVLLMYCVPLALLATPVLRLLYHDKYGDDAAVVVLTSLQYFFVCLVPIVSSLLQVQGLARHLFLIQVYVSAISIPFGWLLVRWLGVEGAVIGMTIGAVATNAYAWFVYRRTHAPRRTLS